MTEKKKLIINVVMVFFIVGLLIGFITVRKYADHPGPVGAPHISEVDNENQSD